MADRVASELGVVDIVVNNAGVLARGDLADFDYIQMESMRRTNVDGLVHATRAVVDGMKLRGWGRIVNLTSVAAHGTALSGRQRSRTRFHPDRHGDRLRQLR